MAETDPSEQICPLFSQKYHFLGARPKIGEKRQKEREGIEWGEPGSDPSHKEGIECLSLAKRAI
jgi:hypothetical protein